MTRKDSKNDKIVSNFLKVIGRNAYSTLKHFPFPDKPISLHYSTLEELLLNDVILTNFESRERVKFYKVICQNN